MKALLRKGRLRFVFALVALGGLTSIVFPRLWLGDNFGVVDRGRVYRAAQPAGETLRRLIRDRNLASVLNLRAGSPADPFYAEEVRVTRALGVDFYDFPMSATRRPTRRELLVLLDLFGRCRYPLLIHCKSGSDRTGLASALYRMAVQGVAPQDAVREFRLAYGHFPIGPTARLHEPLREYQAWLEARHIPHTPKRLRQWVEYDYRDAGPVAAFHPLRPGPREGLTRGGAAAIAR